jgi:hypothetical protein
MAKYEDEGNGFEEILSGSGRRSVIPHLTSTLPVFLLEELLYKALVSSSVCVSLREVVGLSPFIDQGLRSHGKSTSR